jgi:hypothetical protein
MSSEAPLPNVCGCENCQVADVMGIPTAETEDGDRTVLLGLLMTAAFKLGYYSSSPTPNGKLLLAARVNALAAFKRYKVGQRS